MAHQRAVLLAYAAAIMLLNTCWALLQERLGARPYGDGEKRERFTAIPMLNLVQAIASAFVGWVCMRVLDGGRTAEAPPFRAFARAAVFHTIASPVGYMSIRFLPYVFYTVASSCKLVPVLAISTLMNPALRPGAAELSSAALMTGGVVSYALAQISADASHGKSGHHHSIEEDAAVLGWRLSPAASLGVGLLLVLTNLSLEGLNNANQDRIALEYAGRGKGGEEEGKAGKGGAAGKAAPPSSPSGVSPFVMMASMNAWSVLLLGGFLLGEAALALARVGGAAALLAGGASWSTLAAAAAPYSYLLDALRFAQAHPEVVQHALGFSALGALAQIVIFSVIAKFGTYPLTCITLARKFVSVLLSLTLFGGFGELSLQHWAGIVAVFTGLTVQLAMGKSHGHRGHGTGLDAGKERNAPPSLPVPATAVAPLAGSASSELRSPAGAGSSTASSSGVDTRAGEGANGLRLRAVQAGDAR